MQMGINRVWIKDRSKLIVKASKPNILLIGLAYVVILYVIDLLCSYLSGYATVSEVVTGYARKGMVPTYEELMGLVPAISWSASVLIVLNMLGRIMMQAGYQGYCLMISRGVTTTFKDIFMSFGYITKVVVINLVTYIIVSVGFALLIVPGVILSYSYRMAIYIMYDNPQLSPIECMRQSRIMMKGRKMELFVYDLSFIGWKIASGISQVIAIVPILDAFVCPYMGITYAGFYNAAIGMAVPVAEVRQKQQ